jgi:predicted DNA binding CopG/RHH family protein
MPKIDEYELEVPSAFEKGQLKSVATKAELAKLKAAARATAIKDRRVNIRLSSGDLNDIQVKALEEGAALEVFAVYVVALHITVWLFVWVGDTLRPWL